MKKIILAAAIILISGVSTVVVSQENDVNNNVKAAKVARINISTNKNVLGTAD